MERRARMNILYFARMAAFVSLSYQQQARDIVFDDIRPNHLVPFYLVKLIENTELLKCLQACVHVLQCKSVNYNRSKKKCNLLGVSLRAGESCIHKDNEWMYYGSIKESQAEGVYAVCALKEEPSSHRVLAIIPEQKKSWYLSVDIKPNNLVKAYANVIHISLHYAGEIMLFMDPNSFNIYVRTNLDQARYQSLFGTIPQHMYTNIKVMEIDLNGNHSFMVFVNDTLALQSQENNPQAFSNVILELPGIADAYLKNIIFHNIE